MDLATVDTPETSDIFQFLSTGPFVSIRNTFLTVTLLATARTRRK
jgi:hypothetical protein